jgi:hypothetical protein
VPGVAALLLTTRAAARLSLAEVQLWTPGGHNVASKGAVAASSAVLAASPPSNLVDGSTDTVYSSPDTCQRGCDVSVALPVITTIARVTLVLRRDAQPVAITDPHGGFVTWIDDIAR